MEMSESEQARLQDMVVVTNSPYMRHDPPSDIVMGLDNSNTNPDVDIPENIQGKVLNAIA